MKILKAVLWWISVYIVLLFAFWVLVYILSSIQDLRTEQENNAADLQRMKQEIAETEAYIDELQLFMDKLNITEVEATAYTHTGNQTYTGTWPSRGTIAVDPSRIPLGTKVWVEGYGWATAEDTGRLIKGDIIDLFHDTEKECWDWGRQKVTVIWRGEN